MYLLLFIHSFYVHAEGEFCLTGMMSITYPILNPFDNMHQEVSLLNCICMHGADQNELVSLSLPACLH